MKRSLWNCTFFLKKRTNKQQIKMKGALPDYEKA
jgi:hypothetical protein